jgi:phage/plasmid-like protein (TIGR03299 family)
MTETTTRIDVNAQFNASRLAEVGRIENLRSAEGQAAYIAEQTARFEARVKNGELVKLGDGRYQSTEGWDKGEVWTVRAVGGQSLVLPEHGLDTMEGGKARLYTAVPYWHGLGQVIPGGISDVEDVIRLGGLDVPAVSIPAPSYTYKGVEHEVPGKFHLINGDTGAYWGTVGKVHKNLPVRDSFAFMQHLTDKGDLTWETAGLMGEGRKVFISAKLPQGIVVDADGVNDFTELFLVVQDARDGSTSYKAMITPWRPGCGNTNRFALRDALAVISLRHSSGLPAQLAKARDTLGMTIKYAGEFAAEETLLARTATKMAEFEALMAEFSEAEYPGTTSGRVFGARDRAEESTRTRLANDRRQDDMTERFRTERERVGETLFATEQAYTGHLDWGLVRKGTDAAAKWQARIEANLAGLEDGAKSRAHTRLVQLAGGGTERR